MKRWPKQSAFATKYMPDKRQSDSAAQAVPAQDLLSIELEALARGEHSNPLHILGPHFVELSGKTSLIVRVYRPGAQSVSILWSGYGAPISAAPAAVDGVFTSTIPVQVPNVAEGQKLRPVSPNAYRIRVTYRDGHVEECHDPYAFPPLLTEFDIYLLGEGTHYANYEKLGAHIRTIEGVHGVHFGVWAPNARRVSVVGDFNRWDGRTHPMLSRGFSGIWELFVPGLSSGDLYKFEIV
jgi:1,4-alpha-glucan branching enzyme